MEITQLINALLFTLYLSGWLLGALLAGALLGGLLRVATQIDDQVISLAGRLAGAAVLFYFGASRFFDELAVFTNSLWANGSLYH